MREGESDLLMGLGQSVSYERNVGSDDPVTAQSSRGPHAKPDWGGEAKATSSQPSED